MFKIETHLHTCYASTCSQLNAEQIVDGYLAAGYHAVVITDHFHRNTKWFCYSDPPSLSVFLQGYHAVQQAAGNRGLKVFRGAEIRFDGDPNDYLVYGYPDRLLAEPEEVFAMGLEKFSQAAKQAGALLLQAHPCRHSPYEVCVPANAALLDGIEIFNGNPAVDNRNNEAKIFAQSHPELITVSGSDCHKADQIGKSGILAQWLPETDEQFVQLLRSGAFLSSETER